MTAAIEHRTYVASKCPTCHGEVLRVCISHDECEFNHHRENTCESIVRTIATARTLIKHFEQGDCA